MRALRIGAQLCALLCALWLAVACRDPAAAPPGESGADPSSRDAVLAALAETPTPDFVADRALQEMADALAEPSTSNNAAPVLTSSPVQVAGAPTPEIDLGLVGLEWPVGVIAVTGSGAPGVPLLVLLDGVVAAATEVDGTGRWTATVQVRAAGEYRLEAQTSGASGALVSVPLRLLVVEPAAAPTASAASTATPDPAAAQEVQATLIAVSVQATMGAATAQAMAATATAAAQATATPPLLPTATHTRSLTPTATARPQPRAWDFMACASPCLSDGSNAVRTFPGIAYRLHATWQYSGIAYGAHYQRIWSMPDRGEWVRYDCQWDGPESGLDTVALSEPLGLRAGWWEMRILVEGQEIMNESVFVEGSHATWEPVGVLWKCHGKK